METQQKPTYYEFRANLERKMVKLKKKEKASKLFEDFKQKQSEKEKSQKAQDPLHRASLGEFD